MKNTSPAKNTTVRLLLPRGKYLSYKLSANRSKTLIQQIKYNFVVFYIFFKIIRINRYRLPLMYGIYITPFYARVCFLKKEDPVLRKRSSHGVFTHINDLYVMIYAQRMQA